MAPVRGKAYEPERLAARLGRVPQLTVFEETARVGLARGSQGRSLLPQETLWRAGDRPALLGFVLLGELAVERLTRDGHRHVFRRYRQDQVIGLSTVAGAAHTADVVASEETQVLLIPGKALLQEPAFVETAFEYLAKIIGALSDDYQALLYSDIDDRIVRYLRQAELDGLKEIKKSHQELADEIGSTKSNVARAIGRLAKRGIIEQGRGRIVLRAVEKLNAETKH